MRLKFVETNEYLTDWQKQPPEVFCKKGVLRNFAKFTGKHLCQSLFFNNSAACNFINKETLAQVFFREFYKISMNTFFTEHLWTTASGLKSFVNSMLWLLSWCSRLRISAKSWKSFCLTVLNFPQMSTPYCYSLMQY